VRPGAGVVSGDRDDRVAAIARTAAMQAILVARLTPLSCRRIIPGRPAGRGVALPGSAWAGQRPGLVAHRGNQVPEDLAAPACA